MAAAVENPRERPRLVLAVGVLAAVFVATRVALMWRFPWFVDETTFADFARYVHGDIGSLFIAEIDKKGLLPSWLGAALIGTGIAPLTAMRLLAAAGAVLAALCGGLLMRRLYGLREGLLTAALIALGPYFLVTASVGIYDAMVTGLVAAAVVVSLRLVQQPRPYTALLLGGLLGAGGLTKPTASIAMVVLPFTLGLFDWRSPLVRRRLLIWLAHAVVAVGLGYAITCIARFTPLYDRPLGVQNQRHLSEAFDDLGPTVRANWPPLWTALHGYLTLPGLVLAGLGAIVGARRHRAAAALLAVWTLAVFVSAVLLALWAYPRYFATAMVPLSGFVALGALAIWDLVVHGSWGRRSARIAVAVTVAVLALLPAARFDARVLADPVHARYPGLDHDQYVTETSAQTWLGAATRTIERRGGPYPVYIDVALGYPDGIDLRLNGEAVGNARPYRVFWDGTPADLARTRYVITDGGAGDSPPRPGFHLILRFARSDGGAVMRLYERD